MPATATYEREKLEVDAVLASGIFSRAPNLAQLLKYVCTKYFEGAAAEIKEYNIAVEALGRSPEFDQKRDSIVRVEAHRLRRRLKEFYEAAGASHEIQIEIPSGQYTPRFVRKTEASVTEAQPAITDKSAVEFPPRQEQGVLSVAAGGPQASVFAPSESEATALQSKPASGSPRQRLTFTLCAVALLTGAIFAVQKYERFRTALNPGAAVAETPVAAPRDTVRILAGAENGTSYIDAFQRAWQSDRYFEGGWPELTPQSHIVLGTRDQELYRRRREGPFRYNIPLENGVYELRLYFAESVFGDNNVAGGGETTRIFDVLANGKPLLGAFDLISDAGASVADIKVFRDISPAADGKLHLDFRQNTNQPFVNAIEIVPGIPGRIQPIRFVARDRGVRDKQGRDWDPDRYARGGQLIPRPQSSVPGPDAEIYRGERFGNITYTIPVAQPGKYAVNLYFAENWFGPGNPGGGGAGSRTFDVLVNGTAVRRKFDIIKEAGGANRPVVVSLHGVEPTHQGKVIVALVPTENYACINALEVLDESRE